MIKALLPFLCVFCALSPIFSNHALALGLNRDDDRNRTRDASARVPDKSVTGPSDTTSGDARALEFRLRELERALLNQQEAIRKLSDEIERLRAERAAPTSVAAEPTVGPASETASAEASPPITPKAKPASVSQNQDKRNFLETVLPGVKLSGSVLLYSYSPSKVNGARASFDLYGAHIKLDRDGERLGFHLEYRLRTTRLRSFFPGPTWMQEGYVKAKVPGGTVKVGQIYKQLGIFTDYSFYGDLPYFDGLKYNPEWGVSYEGTNRITDRISFEHDVQFFRTDSRINGSYPGRDVVSDPTGRRRNEVVLRGVPHFKLTERASLAVGGSFERGGVTRQFDRDNNTYRRAGGEATLTIGPASVYGEVIHQTFEGTRFPDLPNVTYSAVGANIDFKKFSTHINYSQGNYDAPGRRKEYMIQPGLIFPLGRGFSLYTEYTYWITEGDRRKRNIFDRSLNLVLIFSF